ncbi:MULTISPECIES: asparagine synthase C-terminal domain-containing protein [Brevundimonas]|uniref:asparagine synthase C-terminal domain-containing protein n=1 Tax=Brevundimonas TaxID=41275 RepID=UPI00289A63D0|nr:MULTISPECIES: asparagine synthase C-terminal domain-containing protein [Brevundimonas]
MVAYVLASWEAGDAEAGGRARILREQAVSNGMIIHVLGELAWLGVAGPRPPRLLQVGPWLLVGDILDRRQNFTTGMPMVEDQHAYERKMFRRLWGRYVGFRLGPRGRTEAVLRDPSGSLDCFIWTASSLTLVASDAPDWLVRATRPDWRINTSRLANALADPLSSWAHALVDGPTALLPGAMLTLGDKTSPVSLWRPDEFARYREQDFIDDAGAAERLRDAVDEAVTGLARIGGPLGAEMSGGLDSSIVASSLVRSEHADIRLWLNAYGPDPEADERPYAKNLASMLKVALTTVRRSSDLITEDMLMGLGQGLRPGFNGLDAPNDVLLGRLWAEAGASSVMTGKGGDAVFVQAATSEVFSDIWRHHGWRSVFSPALPALARWNGGSVWSLIAEARRSHRTRTPPSDRTPSFIAPAPAPPPHPWLAAGDDLGPAKLYQIAGVLNGVTFSGASPQTAVVDLLHPLLAQPVVEACLSLSAPRLTLGRRDRALARLAFRDRLPAEIADRRSKGEMTAYYGRRIAASLDVLKPWLLDGRLAAQGLIDRAVAEAALDEETLIWRGGFAEIMIAAALEAWVREWERRLSTAS